MTTTNTPVHKIRNGAISAAIWKNDTKNGPAYSVTTERTYKDDEGFKSTSSFRQRDLLPLARVLGQAYDFIAGIGTEEDSE